MIGLMQYNSFICAIFIPNITIYCWLNAVLFPFIFLYPCPHFQIQHYPPNDLYLLQCAALYFAIKHPILHFLWSPFFRFSICGINDSLSRKNQRHSLSGIEKFHIVYYSLILGLNFMAIGFQILELALSGKNMMEFQDLGKKVTLGS